MGSPIVQVGQVVDMGNRFLQYLQALRSAWTPLTRVVDHRSGSPFIYTPPPAYNDYLGVVPYTVRQRYPNSPPALTLPDTGTPGVVPPDQQPAVPESDPWLLTVHGYYQPGEDSGVHP